MLFTLPHLGAGLIVVGFGEVAILVWRGNTKPWSVVALGFLAVLSGAVIANLSNVTDIVMSLGSSSSIHLTRVQEDVDAKAAQVQEVNEEMKQLTQRTEASEKNVAGMRDDLRKVVRSFIVTNMFSVGAVASHDNPSAAAIDAFTKELNVLMAFAYPDPTERHLAIERILAEMGTERPTPAPTAKPKKSN